MLSYKDIKIIENTLDQHQESNSGQLVIGKVSESLVDLLTSRFYWEIKHNIKHFIHKDQIKNIQISFSNRALSYRPSHNYMKLVNGPITLFWSQLEIGSLADLIWSGESRERVDGSIYQSDIFISQKFSMFIFDCLKKSVSPILTLDDYRINEVYKHAIFKLQSIPQAFYIDLEFDNFNLSISGQSMFDEEFLGIKTEHSHFDMAMISK